MVSFTLLSGDLSAKGESRGHGLFGPTPGILPSFQLHRSSSAVTA
jgi:hypothetical protein